MTTKEILTKKRFTKKDAEKVATYVFNNSNEWVAVTDFPYSGHQKRYDMVIESLESMECVTGAEERTSIHGLEIRVHTI